MEEGILAFRGLDVSNRGPSRGPSVSFLVPRGTSRNPESNETTKRESMSTTTVVRPDWSLFLGKEEKVSYTSYF